MKNLPHFGDIGVMPPDEYALTIDARSPREYDEDHIPAALNLPVLDSGEYAEIGTIHRTNPYSAYAVGVKYALSNMAKQLPAVVAACPPRSKILVYCFRGGKRSKLWADTLRTAGYEVDVLPGGWKRYRAWVREALQIFPRATKFTVIRGNTGCGKTRILHALEETAEQVLDLERLALHRGSVIGGIPGINQPSQKWFDSILLAAFLSFDTSRPIWVEGESKKIGNIQLPAALHEVLQVSPCVEITASLDVRTDIWTTEFPNFVKDPDGLLQKLEFLKPLVGGKVMNEWHALANNKEFRDLFKSIMVNHYDKAYNRSDEAAKQAFASVELKAADKAAALEVAKQLVEAVKNQ